MTPAGASSKTPDGATLHRGPCGFEALRLTHLMGFSNGCIKTDELDDASLCTERSQVISSCPGLQVVGLGVHAFWGTSDMVSKPSY